MKLDTPLAVLQDRAGDVAQRLRIMAHPERLLMLCRMSEGEVSVTELITLTGLSQSAVSQHLATLRDAEAVEVRAEAQTRFYRILDTQVDAIIRALCAVCAPEAMEQPHPTF